jgi:hypothetical protein
MKILFMVTPAQGLSRLRARKWEKRRVDARVLVGDGIVFHYVLIKLVV